MSRISRGQIVALVTIALLFAVAALIFDKIVTHNEEKVEYINYDNTKPNTLLNGNYLEYINLGEKYNEKGLNT